MHMVINNCDYTLEQEVKKAFKLIIVFTICLQLLMLRSHTLDVSWPGHEFISKKQFSPYMQIL
jgi:hypothetical protein